MKSLTFSAGFLLSLTLNGCDRLTGGLGGNSETDDKLVGFWTCTKIGGRSLPRDHSMSFEFTKDGNLIMISEDAEEETREESDFKLDGDKIIFGRVGQKDFLKSRRPKNDTFTIKKLEGDDMVLRDDSNKVEFEFKRQK